MGTMISKKKFKTAGLPLVAALAVLVGTLSGLSACSAKATAGATTDSTYKSPDLYGEVTDVSGNQVTLKLIKVPAIPTGGVRPTGGARPSGWARPTGGARPTGWVRPTGGAFPTGGASRLIEYTGEVKTVIIPVGVQITESTRATDGTVTATVVDISKVSVGSFLSIYYGSNGSSIAKVTLTTTASSGRFGGFGGYGGGNFPSGAPPDDGSGQPGGA